MQLTREEWDKTDGVQAHHVIQSFNPEDNITAQEANEIGRKLAEQIAPGYEAAVYTHTDRDHIHNHIVINSVSFEDGKKYHSDREQLYNIRDKSDELCREHGLSIIQEPTAKERFSMAEYRLVEKGVPLWKDELRTSIEDAKQHTKTLDEMKQYLKDGYNIEMKIQDKNVSFLHPDKQKYCRGKTLGEAYSKDTLLRDFSQTKTQEQTKHTGLLNRTMPSQKPAYTAPSMDIGSRPQKGLDALKNLTQPEQQHSINPAQQQTQNMAPKRRNRRMRSRQEQQRQGPTLER